MGRKTEAEAIGKNDFDFFPKVIADKFWADDQKVIQGKPVINREEYYFDEESRKRWLLTSKLPMRDQTGAITGLVGIGRDITQQKLAEEKLAHEQELLQTLLDNSPDTIYFKDRDSYFVRISKSKAKETLRIARDSYRMSHPDASPDAGPPHLADSEAFGAWLIGKTDFDTHPETYARAAYVDELEIIRSGKPIEGKLEKTTLSDGKTIWCLSTKMPWRDKEGNIVGTFGVSKDVTEIKEAEKALARERLLLRTLIDHLPDCIYAKDTAGRKTLANLADVRNLHCKTEAEAVGKTDFDFFPKEIAEKFWADDQLVIQGFPVLKREEFFLEENGRKKWLLTNKLPLRGSDGKITGLVGIGSDITELKRTEAALRASEDKLREFSTHLERTNRELQDFAYVTSHDLQEPLRKIVVFGDRLKEKSGGQLDEDSRDFLDRMQKAAQRMQTLINDLLTFSRLTTKAHPMEAVNLTEAAKEVVEDLEGRIAQVQGRVELGALPTIDAEPLHVRRLLQNLIGNALKFHRPGESPVVKVEGQIISEVPPSAAPGTPAQPLCRLAA